MSVASRPGGGHSIARLVAGAVLVSLVPLALLTYFSLSLATDAVRREVRAKLSSTTETSTRVVEQELGGLAQLVESYAERRSLTDALEGGERGRDRPTLRVHLAELQRARPGVYTTFLAEPNGTLIEIVPPTPEIVGDDFSFRDWYRGVRARGRTYVSEVYRTQARGEALVVAVATPVRGGRGEDLGILVAAYDTGYLNDFAADLAQGRGVTLKITDQRGVLVASPVDRLDRLNSRAADPRVVAALRGESGVTELDTPNGRRLSAYAPVESLRWTVTASVRSDAAFAAVADLRTTVLAIAGVLAVVLLGGLALLARALRARRRAEDETRRLVDINRAVLDATPDGILLVDADGRRLLENEALRRLSADGAAERRESVYADADVSADQMVDPERFGAFMAELQADPDREAVERLESTDGRAFELYSAPVRESVGGLLGRIFTVRDVTSEREAERLKSELVATVSHELRTPLASILGFAELLIHRDFDADTRERYLGTIHSEAKRLTKLINDFLDLQRIESGSFTLALEPLELGAVLREQVELLSAHSEQHRLELDLPDEPLELLGERERIAQVVANLVSNGIKYSPGGGTVRIAAERRGLDVRVSVSDSGLGIPAAQQQRLFTKFFRVDSSDTREIGGTGLGLSLSREIVEAHGGRIGFESVEGEGSTFWFALPASRKLDGPRSRRVLVVEDDPAAASLLSEYLAADGHEVDVVATGEQAIAYAETEPPALICLDMALAGDLDGWDVLERLKVQPATARIPVVVCTGRNGKDRASALGAADFISKPFSRERILEAVRRLLPGGAGRVLVVDDDPAVRRLVFETLSADGIDVCEAANGKEALAEVAARLPDAVVLDLIMPEMDGFEVLDRLQSDPKTRLLPVIVLTARNLSPAERRLLRTRAASLLEKGAYSPSELRRLVERALVE